MGVNPWLKPMKFAFSIAIFVWTLALLMRYTAGPARIRKMIAGGVCVAMLVEIVCISVQAARGTTSHYNISTTFDAVVFGLMGLMILFNTLLVFAVAILFIWSENDLAAPIRLGIVFGFLLFLLGSAEGFLMIINQGHTVGAYDGGPGLPVFNWSTTAGDMRVPHAVGLHALQILPLMGWLISRKLGRLPRSAQLLVMTILSLGYAGGLAFLFRQASAGRPLLGL